MLLYFCITFVYIYFVFMFCKILTWLITILLQDIVAPYGNTCMKTWLSTYGKLAYKNACLHQCLWIGLCAIYKHSKNFLQLFHQCR